jgi:two-component sensor histidine kinase/CheY-like chemotaxis protein
MISSSAMRLASLATDTLALSRLEQNEFSLALDCVDLEALVRDVARVFSVTRGIDLRIAGGDLSVTGDAARLRQVIENLVGNAIKYSPGGEPIEIAMRARDGTVEIAVRDRGIGIPESERTKLFGRFARASNARALGIGGTGFGLYFSRTIVELHGGRIEVESAEGAGSTFRVVLPVEPPARRTAPRRLAILDPEGDARSYVAHALREDGYAVTVATGVEELLPLLEETAFDAGIVDADRLGIDAETFLQRLPARLPVVYIGVRPPPETDAWDAVLTKPFLMKDLYGAIEGAIGQEAVAANGARRTG